MTSRRNLLLAVSVVVSLGLGILAWQQYQELIQLRAAALKGDERADLQKRLWDAEKRARELEAELAAGRGQSSEAPVAMNDAETPANRAARGGPRVPQNAAALRALMENPEMQHLMSLQQKAALDIRYAALFKKLNLTPEQISKVKDLIIEKQTSRQDVMTAAREQGMDPRTDPAGMRKLMADAQAETDNALKATLGVDGFNQLQQYDQTMPQRSVVTQLQQSLSFTSAPLTDAQAEQLVQVLASTTPRPTDNGGGPAQGGPGGGRGGFGGGPGGMPGGQALAGAFAVFGGGGATVTPEAVTQSQSFLSAPQLQALQQLQQTQQAQQQVQQMIRQTLNPNGDTGNPGAGRGTRRNQK